MSAKRACGPRQEPFEVFLAATEDHGVCKELLFSHLDPLELACLGFVSTTCARASLQRETLSIERIRPRRMPYRLFDTMLEPPFRFANLQGLDLRACSFTEEGAQQLGVVMGNPRTCPLLKELNMAGATLGQIGLRFLVAGAGGGAEGGAGGEAGGEAGAGAGQELLQTSWASLRVLSMSTTGLQGEECIRDLLALLAMCHNLEELDVSDNRIGHWFGRLYTYGEGMWNRMRIRRLFIRRIGLRGQSGGGSVAMLMMKLPSLELVDLAYNDIGEQGAQAFSMAFAFNATRPIGIQDIDISENDILSLDGMMAFCSTLQQFCPRLRRLEMDGNAIFTGESLRVLSRLPDLEYLGLTQNNIGEGSNTIAPGMSDPGAFPHLRMLDISRNFIDEDAMGDLFDALHNPNALPALQRLNVSENPLGVSGAGRIGDLMRIRAVAGCPITALDLSDTWIGCDGVTTLREALAGHGNGSLRELRLANCSLQDRGLQEIAKILEENGGALRSLDISEERSVDAAIPESLFLACYVIEDMRVSGLVIDCDAARGLGTMLARPAVAESLVHLDLKNCAIEPCGMFLISHALGGPAQFRSLRVLNLQGNRFGCVGVTALMVALCRQGAFRSLERLSVERTIGLGQTGTLCIGKALEPPHILPSLWFLGLTSVEDVTLQGLVDQLSASTRSITVLVDGTTHVGREVDRRLVRCSSR